MIGTWQGALAIGASRPRIALVVSRDSSGALVGLMKSLDQGTQAPATVAVHGDTVNFAIGGDRVTYTGIASPSADSVRGTLTQAGQAFPLSFGRVTDASTLGTRPQDPKPPYPYHSEDVTVASDASGRRASRRHGNRS